MQLYTKILIGLIAGAVAGAFANLGGIEPLQNLFATLEPLGTAFINLITMIVIPLVVASLLVGTASLGDLRKLGRIGGKTILYYMSTTAIAVTIGLVFANVLRPGGGVSETTRDQRSRRRTGVTPPRAWTSRTRRRGGARRSCRSSRATPSRPPRRWTSCR